MFPDVGLTGLACNGTEQRVLDCSATAEIDDEVEESFYATSDRYDYTTTSNVPGLGCARAGKPGFALACVREEAAAPSAVTGMYTAIFKVQIAYGLMHFLKRV